MNVDPRDERAERARRLLEDPLLTEMFEAVRQDALGRFENSQADEERVREAAYRELQALHSVRSALKSLIVDARLKTPSQKG